jgi:hypothetical protein
VSFLAFSVPSCADEGDPIAGVSDRAGAAPLDARDDEGDPSALEEQSAGVVFVDPLRNTGPDAVVYRDPTTGLERNAAAEEHGLSTFTPHRVPVGLAFDPGAVLCGDFAGGLFVLSFGASGGTLSDQGRDLELIHFAGEDEISSSRIVSGFGAPIDEVLVENKLYVLDYGLGAIWEVTLPRAP